MRTLKSSICLALASLALLCARRAQANNAGAVVLVNSSSAKYPDFQHFIQPYLGNFGVPYTVLDIASNAVTTDLTNYALIIVGHAQLDTNLAYLNGAAQSNISLAVSNGTGFVSFDNALATNNTALYQFEQSIFGLGFTNTTTSGTVMFPPTGVPLQMPYITSLHATNEVLILNNTSNNTVITLAGLTLPTNVTAVATCGGAPFVVITKYGRGRAVQWASYDWISTVIQGPVNGLDDLVWRGFTWAARKPFVMRGFPNFATVRIDDVMGFHPTGTNNDLASPFWWIHAMTNAGFKPFLALFTDDLTEASAGFPGDGRIVDLSNMVASGLVTASVHSFTAEQTTITNFFYFDHLNKTNYSDAVMSSNYMRGTAFLQWSGIPSSKVVIGHYSEAGTNAFNGLTNWGVEYFFINVVPGSVQYLPPYAPWLMAGPYRLYDTPQQAQSDLPFYYCDWLVVPNHPELNGKIFNCGSEIRNVGPAGEWAPTNDVPGSISRGVAMIKRGFDSLVLGTLYSHEFFIQPSDGPNYGMIDPTNFTAIMQGITNALAPYNPIYVTLDYACQYMRATRTSQLTSADYNPLTGQVTATFTGGADLVMTASYYTGDDTSITNNAATVPMFSGSTNATLGSLPAPAFLLTPVVQNGSNVFTISGQYNRSYVIESGSQDFQNWVSNLTVTLSNDPAVVSLPRGASNQFYRARLLP